MERIKLIASLPNERKRHKPGKIRVSKEVREKSDYVTIQSQK